MLVYTKIKNLLKNINYLMKHNLWQQREDDIVYLTNKILDDIAYEYKLEQKDIRGVKVLTKEESMKMVLDGSKSFVRTGDGECKILLGFDQPFQKYEKGIADGLKMILRNDKENLLVGINGNYYKSLKSVRSSKYYRRHAYDLRCVYEKYINLESTYINSGITSYDFGDENKETCKKQYELWHEAFKNKSLIIVCGRGILDKLDYDVFELALQKKYIYGPRINAWDMHDDLIKAIKNQATKDDIIVFILGMAGKVMIAELSDLGYICWDAGHLAKYYDAFKKALPMSAEQRNDFFAPD